MDFSVFGWMLLGSFCAASFLTFVVRRGLVRRAILDVPNARSLHQVPVPRGGGLAVLVTIMAGLGLRMGQVPAHFFAPTALILPCLLVLFLVSWWDDRFGASVSVRLLAHLFAATLAQFAFPPDQLLLGGVVPFYVERVVIVFGWAWFMNLYNFMDGIDGITGAETICIAAAVGALLAGVGALDSTSADLVALLIGASAGFLVFNWHPARIFLGDVGSVPLGFLCAFLLLKLAFAGFLIPALLIPLYYLADSGITILRRAFQREKIWQAHRTHFYQRAALALGRHDRVVVWIILTNMALCLAALVAMRHVIFGLGLGIMAVAALLASMRALANSGKK